MIFPDDPPKWKWPRDRSGALKYGSVDSEVLIYRKKEDINRGEYRTMRVAIPSDLNMMLTSRFKVCMDDHVRLRVIQDGARRWLVQFRIGSAEPLDLCVWNHMNKPSWL